MDKIGCARLIMFILAILIRLWLISSQFQREIAKRMEITTPLNSLKRIVEGKYRLSIGVDLYSGDILHESPLFVNTLILLMDVLGDYLPMAFILFDILTAQALYMFTGDYVFQQFVEQTKNRKHYASNAKNQQIVAHDMVKPPMYVASIFLFNPYSILNCAAMTTTTMSNMILAILLYSIVKGKAIMGVSMLALATLQSFYPIILISPLYLSIYKRRTHGSTILYIPILFLFYGGLIVISRNVANGWEFVENTYGFILNVTDQLPNVGVYWYFFMEMFEHFRLLFICSFQINVTILYFIPLTIKFRKDPALLAAYFLMLITIFKSYPSIGDFGFTLALIPCWRHLYNCMQQIFLSHVTIVLATAVSPIFLDLWIYWGTANANFFFGATLAYISAHIFLLTDIAFAYTKREYLIKYGNSRKINGENAKLTLK